MINLRGALQERIGEIHQVPDGGEMLFHAEYNIHPPFFAQER